MCLDTTIRISSTSLEANPVSPTCDIGSIEHVVRIAPRIEPVIVSLYMSFVSKASLVVGVNSFLGGEIGLGISLNIYRQYPLISQKPCIPFLHSLQLDFPFSLGIEAIPMKD